jgi:2-haloacid dehalogenase
MAALPLIVFDVNETLLDLETLEPTFQRIFGEKSAMRLWFANFIMYSAALTVAGCYVPFTEIGAAVMKMLADTRGIKIDDRDKKELTEKFSTTPPHPRFQRRYASCAMQVFGSSPSRTIYSKCKRASLSMVASSICLNEDSARTA